MCADSKSEFDEAPAHCKFATHRCQQTVTDYGVVRYTVPA